MSAKALFLFVEAACWHYAGVHGLRLKKVRQLTRSESRVSAGKCYEDGTLAFDLRNEPYMILELMAHELAHLAHWNHDEKWMRLYAELVQEMLTNGELDKIKKVCPILPT